MTRINAIRNTETNRFLTWGKNTSALVFAAVLIICSVTVGCSGDKPKPVTADAGSEGAGRKQAGSKEARRAQKARDRELHRPGVWRDL